MNKNLKNIYIFGFVFVLFDQIIKLFLNNRLILNSNIVLIEKLLSIRLVHNTGAAFSILDGNRIFLIAVGVIAVIIISLYLKAQDVIGDTDTLIYSLLIGGVIGNLIDRIIYGYVIDYISFNIFGYLFPVFNLADMCIVISVILMIFKTIKGDLWS